MIGVASYTNVVGYTCPLEGLSQTGVLFRLSARLR